MSLCDYFNLANLGLLLDIFGAALIYVYGVSDIFNKRGTAEWVDKPEDNEKVKKANIYSSLGFFLIILGFILQIISNRVH